jgi:hypothetical protein
MKEAVDHILRIPLPWRDQDEATTECGKHKDEVKVINREEFKKRLTDLGKQRSAMITCMTCIETVARWSLSDQDIRSVLGREIEWEGGGAYWRSRTDRGIRLKDELEAIAVIVDRHRDEFKNEVSIVGQKRDWLQKKKDFKIKPTKNDKTIL